MNLNANVLKKPRNPFMYYSAFKLAVYYNNDQTRCHPVHSKETKATIAQLLYKKLDEVVLDRRVGFAYCLEHVEQIHHKIYRAILYNAYDPSIQYGKFIAGKWYLDLQPQFDETNMQAVSRIYSVKNGFAILHDIEANTLAIK